MMRRRLFALAMDFRKACHVLGVKPGDSANDVKTAWRNLSKQHHPDVNSNDQTPAMQQINEAYITLKNYEVIPEENTSTNSSHKVYHTNQPMSEAWMKAKEEYDAEQRQQYEGAKQPPPSTTTSTPPLRPERNISEEYESVRQTYRDLSRRKNTARHYQEQQERGGLDGKIIVLMVAGGVIGLYYFFAHFFPSMLKKEKTVATERRRDLIKKRTAKWRQHFDSKKYEAKSRMEKFMQENEALEEWLFAWRLQYPWGRIPSADTQIFENEAEVEKRSVAVEKAANVMNISLPRYFPAHPSDVINDETRNFEKQDGRAAVENFRKLPSALYGEQEDISNAPLVTPVAPATSLTK